MSSPKVPPERGHPSSLRWGGGDSGGEGEVVEVKDEGMQAKGTAKYISV